MGIDSRTHMYFFIRRKGITMYDLFWRSQNLPFTQKQTSIQVPAGSIVSNASSLRFTGKGSANYGKVQQENLIRLLENFAGATQPDYPTVGQLWYDTELSVLKVCVSTAPEDVLWEQLNAYQKSDNEPKNPNLGDLWFKPNGPVSGVLYTYTGIGRFVEKDWDAVAAGYYWPDNNSSTLAIKINTESFSGSSSPGEARLYGKDANGLIADIDGSVLIGSTPYTIDRTMSILTNHRDVDGFILLDTAEQEIVNQTFKSYDGTGALVGTNRRMFLVTVTSTGKWLYDNNSHLVPFTPTSTQYLIGKLKTRPNQNDYLLSGSVWASAVSPTIYNSHFVPATKPKNAIGGWEQVWPQINYIGAREEYDVMYSLLMQLIGDPLADGGSGAFGKNINYLSDLNTLDASLRAFVMVNPDTNVFVNNSVGDIKNLKVMPTSQDWDLLFAAVRYAVHRLDIQSDAINDISQFPMVQDGLPLAPALQNVNPNDLKFLTRYIPERMSNTRVGIMAMMLRYQETMNILNEAIRNKYMLKGIYELSSPPVVEGNTDFFNSLGMKTHAIVSSLAGTQGLGNAERTINVSFTPDTIYHQQAFLNSGGFTMMEISSTPTPGYASTEQDLSLQSIFSSFGKIKALADRTLIFNYGAPATLAMAPVMLGFNGSSNGVSLFVLDKTVGTIRVRVRISRSGAGQRTMGMSLVLTTVGGAQIQVLTHTITVKFSYLVDETVYDSAGTVTKVFPRPVASIASSVGGSGLTLAPAMFEITSLS